MDSIGFRLTKMAIVGIIGGVIVYWGGISLLAVAGDAKLNGASAGLLIGIAVAVAVAVIGLLLMWADRPSSRLDRFCVIAALTVSVVAGLIAWLAGPMSAVSRCTMALTGCEASESLVLFALYLITLAAGVSVGVARRSWIAAILAGLIGLAAWYGGVRSAEWVSSGSRGLVVL